MKSCSDNDAKKAELVSHRASGRRGISSTSGQYRGAGLLGDVLDSRLPLQSWGEYGYDLIVRLENEES